MILFINNLGNNKLNICEELIQSSGKCGLIIDTGTNLLAGPTK